MKLNPPPKRGSSVGKLLVLYQGRRHAERRSSSATIEATFKGNTALFLLFLCFAFLSPWLFLEKDTVFNLFLCHLSLFSVVVNVSLSCLQLNKRFCSKKVCFLVWYLPLRNPAKVCFSIGRFLVLCVWALGLGFAVAAAYFERALAGLASLLLFLCFNIQVFWARSVVGLIGLGFLGGGLWERLDLGLVLCGTISLFFGGISGFIVLFGSFGVITLGLLYKRKFDVVVAKSLNFFCFLFWFRIWWQFSFYYKFCFA